MSVYNSFLHDGIRPQFVNVELLRTLTKFTHTQSLVLDLIMLWSRLQLASFIPLVSQMSHKSRWWVIEKSVRCQLISTHLEARFCFL